MIPCKGCKIHSWDINIWFPSFSLCGNKHHWQEHCHQTLGLTQPKEKGCTVVLWQAPLPRLEKPKSMKPSSRCGKQCLCLLEALGKRM